MRHVLLESGFRYAPVQIIASPCVLKCGERLNRVHHTVASLAITMLSYLLTQFLSIMCGMYVVVIEGLVYQLQSKHVK